MEATTTATETQPILFDVRFFHVGYEDQRPIYAGWIETEEEWITVGWSRKRTFRVDSDTFKRQYLDFPGLRELLDESVSRGTLASDHIPS